VRFAPRNRSLAHGIAASLLRTASRDFRIVYALLGLIAVALGVGLLTRLATPPQESGLLVKGTDWSETSLLNNQPATADLPDVYAHARDVRLWRNWTSSNPSFLSGEVWTAPFVPTPILGIPVGGDSSQGSGNRIVMECTADGRQRPVSRLELFAEMTLVLTDTSGFCTGPVRLGAIAAGQRLLAMGSPLAVSASQAIAIRYLVPLFGALLAAVALGLLWTAASLIAAFSMDGDEAHCVGLTATGAVALGLFWAFSLSRQTGYGALSGLALAASLVILHASFYRASAVKQVSRSLAAPGLAWLIFGLIAVSLWAAIDNGGGRTAANTAFDPVIWSSDNLLPVAVARALAGGMAPYKLDLGSWQVSDRPPLLSGYLLLILNVLSHLLAKSARLSAAVGGQAAGIMFVSLWVPAAWLGLRLVKIREKDIALLLLVASATGFCIFNSIYIWPKLLAGGYGLMMILSLTALADRPDSRTILLCIAAASGALSLLAHGGAVFGAAAALIVYMPTILRQGLRPMLVSAALGIALLAAWFLWQNVYQPHGNALARFALTGDFGFHRRDVPVLTDVAAAYGRLTLAGFLEMKGNALLTLFGLHRTQCSPPGQPTFAEAGLGALRYREFFYLAYATGIAVLAASCCAPFGSRKDARASAPLLMLLLVSVVTILLWLAVMWDCHIVHHFSPQIVLAILIGCWSIAFASQRALATLFAAASCMLTFIIWIVDPLYHALTVRWPWVLFAALLTFAAALSWRSAFGLWRTRRFDMSTMQTENLSRP